MHFKKETEESESVLQSSGSQPAACVPQLVRKIEIVEIVQIALIYFLSTTLITQIFSTRDNKREIKW